MPKIVDHGERRIEIVRAVWRIIASDGFDRATMREIAAEAGFTHGAVKPYFSSKDQLLTFAFEFVFTQTNARMADATAGLHGLKALRACCLEILPTDPVKISEARIVIPFWHQALNDPAKAAIHEDALASWRQAMTGFVRSARDAGDITALIPDSSIVGHLMDMTQGAQITATLTPLVQTAESMEQQLDDYLSLLGYRGLQ